MDLVLIRMKNPGPMLMTRSFVGKKGDSDLAVEECMQLHTLMQQTQQGNVQVVTQNLTSDEISEGTLHFQSSEIEFMKDVSPDHEITKSYIAAIAQYRAQKAGLIIPPGQRAPAQKTEVAVAADSAACKPPKAAHATETSQPANPPAQGH